jgi:hypothetical protein
MGVSCSSGGSSCGPVYLLGLVAIGFAPETDRKELDNA